MKRKFKGLIMVLALCATSAIALMTSGCGVVDKVKDKINQAKCEHVYDDGVETKAATCVDEGEKTYTCTLCGKEKKEDIELVDHVEIVIQGIPATCTEKGVSEHKVCEVCEKVLYEGTVIPAKGHNVVVDAAVPATCTTAGKAKGSHCGTCNEVLEKQTVLPATGHTVVTIKGYAATCTTTGLTDGSKCSVCNLIFTAQEEIAVLGHEYDNGTVTKAATCVATGTIVYTCKTCNATNSQPIPATGEHNVVAVEGVAATCTETGLTSGQKCSTCDKVYVEQEVVPAIGHSYDEGVETKAATCKELGILTYTCTVCAETKNESIDITTHIDEDGNGSCDYCSYGIGFGDTANIAEVDVVAGETIAGNWYRIYKVDESGDPRNYGINLSANASIYYNAYDSGFYISPPGELSGVEDSYMVETETYLDVYIPLGLTIDFTDETVSDLTVTETSTLTLGSKAVVKRLVAAE